MIDIRVPALGESITEATLASWFKKAGDTVAADEIICELETDKVAVEVPSPGAGRLSELLVAEGETVAPDALLAKLADGDATAAADAPPSSPEPSPSAKDAEDAGTSPPTKKRDVEDAPSARRLMEQHGLDRSEVRGTGRDGRVMKPDVQEFAKTRDAAVSSAPAPVPEADQAAGTAVRTVVESGLLSDRSPLPNRPRDPVAVDDSASEERIRMTRLRLTIARRLKEAQNTAAILTTWNEVDMTEVMQLRAEYKDVFLSKHGVKLGFMSFFIKACCIALREIPDLNAEIDGEDLVFRKYVHMGVAVGTPTGLVVPVIRNADSLDFAAIESRLVELGDQARNGRLAIADLQGGTFTISNGGVYGSLMSSPILNPPQSGILGMHKIQERPVVVGGEIVIRPMMYLALSYDHRIVDGKGAVTFLVRVKDVLEDPRRLMLDL